MQEELRTTPRSRMAALLNRSLLGEPWRVDFDQFQIEWPLFLEKFKLTATKAGRLLPSRPDGADDLEHWMDQLLRFCQAEHPSYVALTFSSGGGSIQSVCEASVTYCTWLEREELNTKTLGRHGVIDRELQKAVGNAVETAFPEIGKQDDSSSTVQPSKIVKQQLPAPSQLRDDYFASFQEKIVVLDICWAAKQRYREWIRWTGNQVKDGSKPDRAFRAVLTSGKRPEQYRPEPRPKGWK